MSPASCGGRAVKTLLSLFPSFALALVPVVLAAPALARGGSPAAAPAAARPAFVQPAAAPLRTGPAVVRPVTPPVRPSAGAPHHNGRVHAGHPHFGQPNSGVPLGDYRRHWRPTGGLPPHVHRPGLYSPTFRPNAAWPQQRIAHGAAGVAYASGGVVEPQVIYAPAAAAEAPLVYSHGEAPLADSDYGYAQPCVQPLIIKIGAGAGHGSQQGVRVVHGQASGCATPQVVTYSGPRIVHVGPAAHAPVRSAHKPVKRAAKGFSVVRARY